MNPMADPQYPMQHQMPMHPPGLPPRPRGTSRAVPVVVSAGLAIGVFCGLLFGLGTGDPAMATTPPSTANNVKASLEETPPMTPHVATSRPSAAGVTPTVATTAGAGSAKPPVAAGTVKPAPTRAKIIVELTPSTILPSAKISVDGADVTGGTLELELGDAEKKQVTLVVKAPGFKDHEQKVEVAGDTTVKIELIKRAVAGGTNVNGLKRPPPPGGKKRPPPTNTLIDI